MANRYRYPQLRNSLVGAWCPSVDLSRSTLLVDQSGRGNHGTLTNMDPATDWVASAGGGGKGGLALDFDGIDDYVTMPKSSIVSSEFSISLWVKYRNTTSRMCLISQYTSGTAGRMYLIVNYDPPTGNVSANALAFGVIDAASNAMGSTSGMAVNQWTHIAVVKYGTTCDLLVNGVKTASGTYTTTVENTAVVFGRLGNLATYWLDGQLDDIRLLNRAIIPQEVAILASRRGIAYEIYRAPIVRGATVGTTFTANGIVTGAPTIGTPVLAQLHALTATPIATGAPTLGTPTLTQAHSLSATPVTTGAPTLGTPTITQSGTFTAVGITTGAPTLGSPTLTQSHVLNASPISTGAPTLGTPSLSSGGQLTASPIVTGAPTLGSPTLSQVHSLAGAALACGAPVLGVPTLTQRHQLVAIGIVTGAPTLGTPGDAVASVSIPWVVSKIPSILAW